MNGVFPIAVLSAITAMAFTGVAVFNANYHTGTIMRIFAGHLLTLLVAILTFASIMLFS